VVSNSRFNLRLSVASRLLFRDVTSLFRATALLFVLRLSLGLHFGLCQVDQGPRQTAQVRRFASDASYSNPALAMMISPAHAYTSFLSVTPS
jgi:hypothetical protein